MNIYGIRHHGPGSTKSLLKALLEQAPDIILIEGPPDANDLIQHVGNNELNPPIAILVYNPKDFTQASYFPFATFSPEWQAMKYGITHQIPVRFMDLPMGYNFSLDKMPKDQLDLLKENEEADQKEQKFSIKDPFAFFAHLAGFTDSERWWEVTFEQAENQEAIFPAIIEMISAMREESKDKLRTLQREAYMRQTIRAAQKEGFENIAVVCGAWHAPTLDQIDTYKASADKAFLKGVKKIKTKATWVPWSYNRLSFQSGYRAGIISPAWYHLLYQKQSEAVIIWMTKVARLFREEDLDASSAHVIEAVRLANTLATLRNIPLPGIDELYEAAISIFCEGYESKMEVIQNKLVIGDVMGNVPEEIPVIPLQQDLEKKIKSARLSKERKSTDKIDKKLDLRKGSNLLASHLLHRLRILNIPWGTEKRLSRSNTGNFSELWQLNWQPDFAISVIEAGMWGNTVSIAASNFIRDKADKVTTLPALTKLVETTLKADLKEAIEKLVEQLQDVSAITRDVHHLMEALPPLVNAIRYGSTRKLDITALQIVVDQMVPRICVGLPAAATAIDEEASQELMQKILSVNHSIGLLEKEIHHQAWQDTLGNIAKMDNVNGILTGICTRLLFDKLILNKEDIAQRMRYALSKGQAAQQAAFWIEGFLHGSALLLIHNPELWNILDKWIAELKTQNFDDLLPLLRRTFSEFSHPERNKMMQLAKKQISNASQKNREIESFDQKRGEQVLPTVKLILGI